MLLEQEIASQEVKINTPFIKLGQFLKLVGVIINGAEAKIFLVNNKVFVNEEIEQKRGRKLYHGDVIVIEDNKYILF